MKHLKHLKHALATRGSLGSSDSSRLGRSRCCASTTTTISSSAGLGSARRAVRATGGSEWRGMGERDGRERVAWDRHAATARRSGRATCGREGRGWRKPPRWTRLAARRRRSGCARSGRIRAVVGKENVVVFFYFLLEKPRRLKVEQRRYIGPDHWAGPATSRPNGTRWTDGCPYVSIIVGRRETGDWHGKF
jgi:hypothetical protein